MTEEMRAAVCPAYGPPEVVEVRWVPRPTPSDGEVLVRVQAAIVEPADCAIRQGSPAVARLFAGLRRPKHAILGSTLAGQVEAVGDGVELVEVGDRVLALSPKTLGAHAEYTCLPQDGLLAPMTSGMSFEQAASVLEATTALTFLRDVAHLHADQRILINGAAGSVGAYAVQIAKHLSAHVTGVCSTANLPLVASLGADEVIDRTVEDFTRRGHRYDAIFDAVTKSSFARCRDSLTPDGVYLFTVPAPGPLASVIWTSIRRGQRARFAATGLMQRRENLAFLAGLFEAGSLTPVIDRRYPLTEIVDAYRYVEPGHKTGTVVIVP